MTIGTSWHPGLAWRRAAVAEAHPTDQARSRGRPASGAGRDQLSDERGGAHQELLAVRDEEYGDRTAPGPVPTAGPTHVITVGVLTPHATAGADVEFSQMAPAQVRTKVSRIRTAVSSTSDGGEPPTSPEGLRELATPAAINEAASAFRPGSVDALAFASTSSGYAIGYDAESALQERLRERWGVPVCAAALSAVGGLRSHHIQRISLVHPPWFGHSLNQLGAEYFQSQGFEVVDAHLADLPNDPDQIEPAMVVEWISQHISHRAEAVIIGGNGFRAARAIHELEDRLGRLVLEANQVLLWSILEGAGLSVTIQGFGLLFDDMVVR